ncbi:hypothetical protein PAXRUDRAFT_821932 [Paxillus rubicundulus Ve08.2h10]|uniref:Uncharacterized protein n=1 Tax=Paxillus rubicundulus Ve08.2h10 TaxID=930991 RepID=A0A0D0E5T2_9AGAM|nr:hypothetical protein PAXRUDRAFT_821932 [Paxillus rubicundulus Ve08.2h10]
MSTELDQSTDALSYLVGVYVLFLGFGVGGCSILWPYRLTYPCHAGSDLESSGRSVW